MHGLACPEDCGALRDMVPAERGQQRDWEADTHRFPVPRDAEHGQPGRAGVRLGTEPVRTAGGASTAHLTESIHEEDHTVGPREGARLRRRARQCVEGVGLLRPYRCGRTHTVFRSARVFRGTLTCSDPHVEGLRIAAICSHVFSLSP